MKKSRSLTLLIVLGFQTLIVFCQDTKIAIPTFNDKYSAYVKQLEDGKTNIDYTDFRDSFLESRQYGLKGTNYDSLKEQVYLAIQQNKYAQVINLTKTMLSIDYTSMFAHKYLQQSYKLIGDTINRKKYYDIEFGLLNSISKSGDGKTCETGWHITQIEEEYFILFIINADLQSQSLISSGNNYCDKMEIRTEKGELITYYFEVNKVVEMEEKLFKK